MVEVEGCRPTSLSGSARLEAFNTRRPSARVGGSKVSPFLTFLRDRDVVFARSLQRMLLSRLLRLVCQVADIDTSTLSGDSAAFEGTKGHINQLSQHESRSGRFGDGAVVRG
jgi:hypothetical protein